MKLTKVTIRRDLRAFAVGVLVGDWRQVLPTMTTYSKTIYVCLIPGLPIVLVVQKTGR